jgi:hypothetical protein
MNIAQCINVRLSKPVSPCNSIQRNAKVAQQHQDAICSGVFNDCELIWAQGYGARTPQAASSPVGRAFHSLGDLPTCP